MNGIVAPIVAVRDGVARANSRDVAAAFGKNHKDVLRKVDELLAALPHLHGRNFAPTSIEAVMPNGGVRTERAFDMDRKAFSLLAMRFTGAKALAWQDAYTDEFERMEVALHGSGGSVVETLGRPAREEIGGITRGVIHRALREMMPAIAAPVLDEMLAARVGADHYSVSAAVTAGEVVGMAGLKDRRGLRGLPQRVSSELRRHYARQSRPTTIGTLGGRTAYTFDRGVVRDWLDDGGRAWIERLAAEKRGQGTLALVRL